MLGQVLEQWRSDLIILGSGRASEFYKAFLSFNYAAKVENHSFSGMFHHWNKSVTPDDEAEKETTTKCWLWRNNNNEHLFSLYVPRTLLNTWHILRQLIGPPALWGSRFYFSPLRGNCVRPNGHTQQVSKQMLKHKKSGSGVPDINHYNIFFSK